MNGKVKKALALVAAKKAFDQIQERRKPAPKPSRWGRLVPIVAAVAATGGLAYLAKSGRLQPVVEKVKDKTTSNGSKPDASYRPEAHPVGGPVS